MGKARIGYAKEIINPPLGTPLCGYNYERYAEGIHDNLYARIIVIEDVELFVLVQLDLIAVDRYLIDLLGNKLAEKYKIKQENLLVSCIHTHSGPTGMINPSVPANKGTEEIFSFFDHTLVDYIVRQVSWGVGTSLKNLSYFTIAYRNSRVQGVATNRRNPEIPINDELQILIFKPEDGKKIIIYNYSCHPTVMNQFNSQVSADYPGEVAGLLEAQNDIACVMFYNGECGDVSTRFTRTGATFAEVKRIGDILAGEILKLISQQSNMDEELEEIQMKTIPIELNVKTLINAMDAKRALAVAKEKKETAEANGIKGGALRLYQAEFEGATQNLHLVESFAGIEKISMEAKVLKINNWFIVYIPGELFTSLGRRLKDKFTANHILISCYSNGYSGYIPDTAAYNQGGYETLSTPLAAGEGEKLVDKIADIIDIEKHKNAK